MNFAGIHDLPVVFLVENNLYAIFVPAKMQVAGSIAGRAEGYGFSGIEVDGNDLLAAVRHERSLEEVQDVISPVTGAPTGG